MINYTKFRTAYWLIAMALLFGGVFVACEDDINVGRVDEERYETNQEVIGYLVDGDGKRSTTRLELRRESQATLHLDLSRSAQEVVNATFQYDQTVLDNYNLKHGSSYAPFPKRLVSLAEAGATVVEKGAKRSRGVTVTCQSDEELETDATYVIPLRAEIKSGGVKPAAEESTLLIFVKDYTKIPDCNKASGIKIISCMEVNDTNPLNNLCFTLKKSGKPLVDMLILFSANINYNPETGKVYVFNNPNVKHLLDNRLKYLKPLQDRGMKVVLGILGNHDRAGVANLADETAKAFALELKGVCDAYQLDGVFFDDEYSQFITPPPPGFVTNSSAAAARLCYEVKQAMPDKLVCVYAYSTTYSLPSIEGKTSGQFVDYGIHDYLRGTDLSTSYPGMPKSGMALHSQEFSRGYFTSESNLRSLRSNGYGAHMIFAMDPLRSNFTSRQKPALTRIASTLFDDELVYDEKPYAKDW